MERRRTSITGEHMNEDILVYPVPFKSFSDIIKIKPLMDLHKGARTCDIKAFKSFIREADDNTYFFTAGDLWDSIYFDDKRYRPSGHDLTGEDDPIDIEVKEMAALLMPIKDRLIAIGTGNHEDTITKKCHTNPSKRLAEILGVPYCGYSYWFRFSMGKETTKETRKFDFFVSHGFGGGTRTEGGSVTKYSRFADRFSADVLVFGHDHRKQYVRYPVFTLSGVGNVKLYSKPKVIVLGGSWKKTYSSGTNPTWEETKGFPPTEIGGVTIELKAEKENTAKISVSM
jgi:UDP-2,3-diacylglucosamine pyrophosphatase LpxH